VTRRLLLAAGLALAGCGGDGERPASSPSTSITVTAEPRSCGASVAVARLTDQLPDGYTTAPATGFEDRVVRDGVRTVDGYAGVEGLAVATLQPREVLGSVFVVRMTRPLADPRILLGPDFGEPRRLDFAGANGWLYPGSRPSVAVASVVPCAVAMVLAPTRRNTTRIAAALSG
jgi:hypothetical protein